MTEMPKLFKWAIITLTLIFTPFIFSLGCRISKPFCEQSSIMHMLDFLGAIILLFPILFGTISIILGFLIKKENKNLGSLIILLSLTFILLTYFLVFGLWARGMVNATL